MTRRPIFAGIATILTLVLTAGLAYGAGRMVSTRSDANQVRHQAPHVAAVMPGFGGFYGSSTNARFTGPGTAFRDQMRQWIRDGFQTWLGRSMSHGTRWTNPARNRGRTGSLSRPANYAGGRSNHSGNGYRHHSQRDSGYNRGNHMGSWNGGYGGGCCGW
jgi:hypothetical protein